MEIQPAAFPGTAPANGKRGKGADNSCLEPGPRQTARKRLSARLPCCPRTGGPQTNITPENQNTDAEKQGVKTYSSFSDAADLQPDRSQKCRPVAPQTMARCAPLTFA